MQELDGIGSVIIDNAGHGIEDEESAARVATAGETDAEDAAAQHRTRVAQRKTRACRWCRGG